jgi:GT2 family glycosyltransferase
MVTDDRVVVTRMAVESVLGNTAEPFELVVIDNASSDGTRDYLELLASRNPVVRVILNDTDVGFAAANNQGLATATAPNLVLLDNDTIVPPGWLPRLLSHLADHTSAPSDP